MPFSVPIDVLQIRSAYGKMLKSMNNVAQVIIPVMTYSIHGLICYIRFFSKSGFQSISRLLTYRTYFCGFTKYPIRFLRKLKKKSWKKWAFCIFSKKLNISVSFKHIKLGFSQYIHLDNLYHEAIICS